MKVQANTPQALKIGGQAIDTLVGDIQKIPVEAAHKVDPIVTMTSAGGLQLANIRAEDPYTSEALRARISCTTAADTISKSLQSLTQALQDPNDQSKSRLSTVIDEFVVSANSSVGTVTQTAHHFLKKAGGVCEALTDAKKRVTQLTDKATQELQDLGPLNELIKNLANINTKLTQQQHNDPVLLDIRDRTLCQISQQVQTIVHHGPNGQALVSVLGGQSITDARGGYAQFKYKVADSTSPAHHTLCWYSDTNIATKASGEIRALLGSASGGIIGANYMLVQETLPGAKSALDTLQNLVVTTCNNLHNQGSPYPPPTQYISTKAFTLSDATIFQREGGAGTLEIAVVQSNGSSVSGNSGNIRPITIDLPALSSSIGTGGLALDNLRDEINTLLNSGPTANRVMIGPIYETVAPAPGATPVVAPLPAVIPNQCLLNNAQLVRRGPTVAGSNVAIDLDLDGNNYFSCTVEVTGVQVNGNAVVVGALPDVFNLAKGKHCRTDRPINLTIPVAPPPGPQLVDVTFRVISESGTVSSGTARYSIDPANLPAVNARIPGIPVPAGPGPGPGPGDMLAGLPDHAPVVRAKLVDKNGDEVTDPNTSGFFSIEATGTNGIIIGGTSNLTSRFGMNNLLVQDETGQIHVRPDIGGNCDLLSIGKVSQGSGTKTVRVGDASATGVAQFNGVPLAVPAAGTTVTIAGDITYIFQNPPVVAPNDIPCTGVLAADLNALATAINSNKSSLVTATFNNIDTITFTAKNPGISGNALIISIATAAGANNIPLAGGTDKDRVVSIAGPVIGSASTQTLQDFANLQNKILKDSDGNSRPLFGHAMLATGKIATQAVNAERDVAVSEATLELLGRKLKETTGIDEIQTYQALQQFQSAAEVIVAAYRMIIEINKTMLGMFQ